MGKPGLQRVWGWFAGWFGGESGTEGGCFGNKVETAGGIEEFACQGGHWIGLDTSFGEYRNWLSRRHRAVRYLCVLAQ